MRYSRLIVFSLFLATRFSVCQTPAQFEVASVKPHPAGDENGHIGPHPGGFEAVGIPLKILITVAYGVKEYQITGGPDWINSDRYDVLAKAPGGVNPNYEQLQSMLQSLLADRFQLNLHHETRELPSFALVVSKGGAKLKPSPAADTDSDQEGTISVGRGMMTGQRLTMAGLADALSRESDRAIVDKTGIAGKYDVALKWTPEAAQETTEGSLFTAIQEQLGLRLESVKAGVDVVVIDHAEKASAN